jgi:TonB family protein
MNTLLIYMTKAAFYLAAFYMVYSLMLSSDTMHKRNRAFILLSILSALILPLITLQTNRPVNIPVFGMTLSEIIVYGTKSGTAVPDIEASGSKTFQIFWIMYISGLFLFGTKLIIDIIELSYLIIRKKSEDSHIIRFQGLNTAGFSALGYVFINSKLTTEEANEIIKHEQNHIDQNHFADIAFVEIISVIQWFNPFIHLFNRSLRAVHEFQADEGCLRTGIPVCSYQNLLLNQVFKSNIINLTNCFSNPTLIKKRMIMMTKKRSGALANIKLLVVLPAVAAVMLAFSSEIEKQASELISVDNTHSVPGSVLQFGSVSTPLTEASTTIGIAPPSPPPPVTSNTNVNTEIQITIEETAITPVQETIIDEAPPTEVFVIVEEMPSFPGGDAELMNFINNNIQYPEIAKANNIQGRVFLRFCVTYKGNVEQISVIKGVDTALDTEAKRVVSMLPAWKPGKQGGKPVNVWFQLPITFQLKE